MNRIACAAVVALVVAFSALTAQQPQPVEDISELSATDDASALAAAIDRFGGALAAKIDRGAGNLCLSPASLGLCLLMTLPGARGESATELQRLLGPADLDVAHVTAAAARLQARLRSDKITILAENQVWLQDGHPVLAPYRDALQKDFGAPVRIVDFLTDPAAARAAINDSIAKATNGRIADLLSADAIGKQTRMVLTNALYVHADWSQPFRAGHTIDDPFRRLDGMTVKVPTMHLSATFDYAEADGVQLLRLPYVDRTFAFEIALPGPGVALAAAEQALLPQPMDRAVALQPTEILLALPRFHLEGSFSLREPLASLGLATATTPRADFSGIDGGAGKLFIAAIVHRTVLDVAEKGTDAAAATAVIGDTGGPSSRGKPFTVNRPFAFALRDLTTGLALFAGRVVDPQATAH